MSDVVRRLQAVGETLDRRFLGRSEVIRLLLLSVVAREHAVLIGPPGTAKSALLRTLAHLLDARYFEYLLTRFTEPSEIFGPVDIHAFRDGTWQRRTAGMLPEAEIVFLDEVFKGNSAILNTLLTLLNERQFSVGGSVQVAPLLSAFGASNEVPTEEGLEALFDRFLVRIRTDTLEAHLFAELLGLGVEAEVRQITREPLKPLVAAGELVRLQLELARGMRFSPAFLGTYKSLVFQLRAEGVWLSDRRAVKLLKLFAASALLDGRSEPDDGDLFVLRHVWNTPDQAAVIDGVVQPVLEAFHREAPGRRRVGAVGVGVPALVAEVERIRVVLTGPTAPSDLQLFSQLRALGEIRAALAGLPDPAARALEQRVVQLLDAALSTGRFAL